MSTSDDDINDALFIVGLRRTNNGRSCHAHSCCGDLAHVGLLVRFKFTVIDNRRGTEQAIACVAVRNGQESCRIGFLPRERLAMKNDYIDKFAQVTEMYEDHESAEKRRVDNTMCGAAECILLDEIPAFE